MRSLLFSGKEDDAQRGTALVRVEDDDGCPYLNTSFEPRPNPFTTFPFSFSGYGGSGPASGPVTGSRWPSGRMAWIERAQSMLRRCSVVHHDTRDFFWSVYTTRIGVGVVSCAKI